MRQESLTSNSPQTTNLQKKRKKLYQFFLEDIKFSLFDGKVFINGAKKSSLTKYNALASKLDEIRFDII